MNTNGRPTEGWGTRIGVILAVAGSAVGLGNFLRFPGLAAQYEGGAFMIPYFAAFLILGLPLAWAEWSLGRHGGRLGFNSTPGVYYGITKSRFGAYVGVLGLIVPVMIYMFYVFVEAWCLGFAWRYLVGDPSLTGNQAGEAIIPFVGITEDGSVFSNPLGSSLIFIVICFVLNFFLIYRGINRGIELFCNVAMPALVICAIIILIRVLTLPANPVNPSQNVMNGLGYMWNPSPAAKMIAPHDPTLKSLVEEAGPVISMPTDDQLEDTLMVSDWETAREALIKAEWQTQFGAMPIEEQLEKINEGESLVWRHQDTRLFMEEADKTLAIQTPGLLSALLNADIWLAASGQIFFSLSVGFGIIITYSSYLKRDDDISLSSLTAAAGNGWCEVALGGLILIPACFIFLGALPLDVLDSSFQLGFMVLPQVFESMPGGRFFGFLFFFLLFLAAVTSSLSMLQPAIAFFEEGLGINRKSSVALLGLLTLLGTGFVVYFTSDLAALDALDFWVATFCIYILATIQVIIFGWVLGLDKGFEELDRGAEIRVPRFVGFVLKYISPLFLLVIFGFWLVQKLPERLSEVNLTEGLTIGLILVVAAAFLLLIGQAVNRWEKLAKRANTRCPECGQDLTGQVSPNCPNCGRSIPDHVLVRKESEVSS